MILSVSCFSFQVALSDSALLFPPRQPVWSHFLRSQISPLYLPSIMTLVSSFSTASWTLWLHHRPAPLSPDLLKTWLSEHWPSVLDLSRWWVEDCLQHPVGALWIPGNALWPNQSPWCLPVVGKRCPLWHVEQGCFPLHRQHPRFQRQRRNTCMPV